MESPAQIRHVKAYANVLSFLEKGTTEELRTFQEHLERDRSVLERFGKPMSRSGSGRSRRGGIPSPRATGRSFFTHLSRFLQGRSSKEALLKEWRSIGITYKGVGPFIEGVWDSLPSEYRSKTMRGGGGRRMTRKNRPVRGFAVVHTKEKPWVKEPNYQRWLAKLRRHTRHVAQKGEDKNPMNMCVDSSICKGDLGIPRRLMPQFTSPRDIRSFTEFIKKHYGIGAVRATRRAGQLRPSQEEINRERVEDVKEEIIAKKLNPNVPLIVSADGYVIDGHHRWAAYKSHEPSKRMPVLLVKDSARDVLSMAATWGAKHHQF